MRVIILLLAGFFIEMPTYAGDPLTAYMPYLDATTKAQLDGMADEMREMQRHMDAENTQDSINALRYRMDAEAIAPEYHRAPDPQTCTTHCDPGGFGSVRCWTSCQ